MDRRSACVWSVVAEFASAAFWKAASKAAGKADDAWRWARGVGRNPASNIGPVSRFLESAQDVFVNPSVLRGRTLDEVRTAIGHTLNWIQDVMRRSRTNSGGGWVFREVNASGETTGRLIQFHPGTHRHFGGMPYWKVSGIPNQSAVRFPAN